MTSAIKPHDTATAPVPLDASITILLADDHHLYREGMRRIIDAVPEMTVVGEAEDCATAVRLAQSLHPHVVLLDLNLPGMDGINVVRTISTTCPSSAVIVLSMYWQDDYAAHITRAGARGYLLKNAREEDVLRAIRLAVAADASGDPNAAHAQQREFNRMLRHEPQGRSQGHVLTRREIDLLRSLVAGKSNREIASDFGLAESTIKNNLSGLFQKIGARDRTQAVLFAFSSGLVPQPVDSSR